MGCCSTKISEEKSIYNFFINMYKTNKFEFTIENYDNNYENIKKNSNNNFKKLEKKQEVRIKFLKMINRYIKSIKKNDNEDNYSNKALYIIIILTILIDNYLNQANNEEKKNNDLYETLLKISSELYFYNLTNLQKYKIILYYLGKLFEILFKIPFSISNIFNINKYINCLNNITINSVLTDNEFILFIKVHLISLGKYFEKVCEKTTINLLREENEKTLINYYLQILIDFKDFIINNNEIIKKNYIYNSEKYLNDKNFNIYNNGNLLTEENNNILKNNNIDLEKLNELENILDSFFYFIILSIKDKIKGYKLIKNFDEEFNSHINNIKFNEVIILFLLNKTKSKINEPLISCLIDIIKEKINDEVYNNILLEFFIFIFEYNILKEYRIELLAEIFINNLDNENTIIEKIVKFINNRDNELIFIIKLILNLSKIFKTIDYNKKIILLQKISGNLLKSSKNNFQLNNFDKDDIFTIINNFNIYNNTIKDENVKLNNTSEYDKNKNIIINYFKFFDAFINFTMMHINMEKVYDNIETKNIILSNILKYIFQYINFSKDNNCINNIYIEEIFSYFKLFINFINKYNFDLQSIFKSYKLLEKIFKNYYQNESNLNIFTTFYIYDTILFLLCLFKRIDNLQITLISEHNNIINMILKLNLNLSEQFKKYIPLHEYLNNKTNYFESLNIYKNSVIEYFNNNYNNENIEISKDIIKLINNNIYNEIFNYQSNINNYFETQNEENELILNNENIQFNWENNNDTNTIVNGINLNSYLNDYDEKTIEIKEENLKKSINMLQQDISNKKKEINNNENISNFIKDNNSLIIPENLGINL